MFSLAEVLGFDPSGPEARRAQLLASNDRALLRELIAIRKERGVSQREVGEMMGISQPSVAAFEAHDSNPKLSTIRRYAHAVGALIRHTVASDDGQLGDPDRAAGWQTARLEASIRTPTAKEAVQPFRLSAVANRDSTRADLALAA